MISTQELASHVQQPSSSSAPSVTASTATLHVHLQRHLSSLRDRILLRSLRVLHTRLANPTSLTKTQRKVNTNRIPLTTLLIKQLRSLRHSQPNKLILPTLPILLLPTRKHLQRLHSSRRPDVLRASLAFALPIAVQVLMLLHRVVFIDVLFLQLALLSRQQTKRGTEEAGISSIAGVRGRVVSGFGVLVGGAVAASVAAAVATAVRSRGLLASSSAVSTSMAVGASPGWSIVVRVLAGVRGGLLVS